MKLFTWTQYRERYFLGDWVPRDEVRKMEHEVGETGPYAVVVNGSRGTALLQVNDEGQAAARWCTVRLPGLPAKVASACAWGFE